MTFTTLAAEPSDCLELGFKPAVWQEALTDGLHGHIAHFDNDALRIALATSTAQSGDAS